MSRARLITAASLVAVSALMIAGCGGTQDGSNPAGDPIAPSSAAPVPGNTEGASAADIAAANLVPCPASDPAVPARSDGLPDLTLACLGEGPAVRLAGVRGMPMVVNVWASWCGPCRDELPMTGDFYRKHRAQVQFLGIDLADDRTAALQMAGQTAMTFPSVQDPDSQVRAGLKIVGVPATLFVRPDGTIAGRAGVVTSEAELAALIEKYLQVKVS